MKIKVCGMSDPRNICAVASLDIDMMGFIFAPQSPRYVGEGLSLSEFLNTNPELDANNGAPKRVGVFVNSTTANIAWYVTKYKLDYVQLHGNESRSFVMRLNDTLADTDNFNVEIIKAINVNSDEDIKKWEDYKDIVDVLLFDTKGASAGGNGTHFNWNTLNNYNGDIPFLLSGGLGPDDVDKILNFHHERMMGIDLNSRFESTPRIKDVEKLKHFVDKIRANKNVKSSLLSN